MVAAPFKAILKFKCQDGYTLQVPCTVSDVNAAYYIFPSGASDFQLPSTHGNVYLVDVVLSAAGTDTSTGSIYANDKTTGEVVMNSSNLGTNFSRQFMGAPVGFAPAARVRIVQVT